MHVQLAELALFDRDRAKTFYIDIFDCRVAADQPRARTAGDGSNSGSLARKRRCPSSDDGMRLLPPSPFSSSWTTMSKPPSRDSNREASKLCQSRKTRLRNQDARLRSFEIVMATAS
jgi:hypothetical protein